MPPLRTRAALLRIGEGLIGRYTSGPDGVLRFEGPRPGPGWHRHDWRSRRLTVRRDAGLAETVVARRRWLRYGTTQTQVDITPDEVGATRVVTLLMLLKTAAWLLAGVGLHTHDDPLDPKEKAGTRRTVQRWLHRLLPDATRLQGALRTAVIERSEPQPIEKLFPGGLSPPEVIRCRRWKDPDATYRLATALAFLVHGAAALSTSVTVLLAEAQKGLDGPLGTPKR